MSSHLLVLYAKSNNMFNKFFN